MMSDLPANVRAVPDRHGKIRYRFRRKGWPSAYINEVPGTAEFHRAYAEIIDRGPNPPASAAPIRKVIPRSLEDLYHRLKKSPRWQRKAPRTQHVQTLVLDRFMDRIASSGLRYGDRPVTEVTVGWLDNILGSMSETPGAANVLRKYLAGLMDHAIRLDWRSDNPVRLTDTFKEGEGLHTWTDEEIEQYRAKHALGTMARLTLELALNTAARRCNIARLTRDDIKAGRIFVAHVKGNNETSVPLLASTKAALDALPAAPIKFLVTSVHGTPFAEASLGNRMRKWCDEAGLKHCSIHGLRKAVSRQLAERGASDAEGQSITGHKKAETFQHYRAKANRALLADRAMERFEHETDNSLSNVVPGSDVQPTESEGIPRVSGK